MRRLRELPRSPLLALSLLCVLLAMAATGVFAENIAAPNQYAYSEREGWINFKPGLGPGVTVTSSDITGYAWGERIGWVSLSCHNDEPGTPCGSRGNWEVTNDTAGNLRGYAWSERKGWISFSCKNTNPTCAGPDGNWGVVINPTTGVFSGKAWGENVGWISFDDTGAFPFHVETSWRASAGATFVVNTNDDVDNGTCSFIHCSLREAINVANAAPGAQTIAFNIPGGGVHTITPAAELPSVSDAVTIDATTQPGYAWATPQIELKGGAGRSNGLDVTASMTLKGMVINGPYSNWGVNIHSGGTYAVLASFVGTNATGTAAVAGSKGIYTSAAGTQIGDGTSAGANVISGNSGDGVLVAANSVTVKGNFIGTDKTGASAIANGGNGVEVNGVSGAIVGGGGAGEGNVLSGNAGPGVLITGGSGNTVAGNFVGTNAGFFALSDGTAGIRIAASTDNTIGGLTAGARNIIANGVNDGIVIDGSSGPTTGNVVVGNYIGLAQNGTTGGGNHIGVLITSASNNTIGGTSVAARNIIVGSSASGVSITGTAPSGNVIDGNYFGLNASGAGTLGNYQAVAVWGSGNVVGTDGVGNYIANSSTAGIANRGDHTSIRGNTIGLNVAGAAAANLTDGIYLNSPASHDNTVASNAISGNTGNGIRIADAGANSITGNRIGTNPAGTAAAANGASGILVAAGAGNMIGGSSPGSGNVISGNAGAGIALSGGSTLNSIEGNYIGTNAAGAAAVPNGGNGGIDISGAPNNFIGGSAAGAGNVISGNAGFGVSINGSAPGNVIKGNYIGTDASGNAAIANADGIFVDASGQIVGDTTGGGNTVSGNTHYGVLTYADSNNVAGNFIGVNATGSSALANGYVGIAFRSTASDNTVTGNVVASNGQSGFDAIGTGTGNRITQNSIHDNGLYGIDLNNDGVTPNDLGDADVGPNNLQNYPVLTGATADVGMSTTIVDGTLNSTASTTLTVELYDSASCDSSGNGEGETLLTSYGVTTDGGGNATINATLPIVVTVGHAVTATATDPLGNTSEFSACVPVTSGVSLGCTPFDDCDQDPLFPTVYGDGCPDTEEPSKSIGGVALTAISPWDFYSVPVPALFAAPDPTIVFRTNTISAGGAQAVFAYFKAGAKAHVDGVPDGPGVLKYEQDLNNNGVKDGWEYDRKVSGLGPTLGPDGVISSSEAQKAFAEFKATLKCTSGSGYRKNGP